MIVSDTSPSYPTGSRSEGTGVPTDQVEIAACKASRPAVSLQRIKSGSRRNRTLARFLRRYSQAVLQQRPSLAVPQFRQTTHVSPRQEVFQSTSCVRANDRHNAKRCTLGHTCLAVSLASSMSTIALCPSNPSYWHYPGQDTPTPSDARATFPSLDFSFEVRIPSLL